MHGAAARSVPRGGEDCARRDPVLLARDLVAQFQGRRAPSFRLPMLPAAAMQALVLANDSGAGAREIEAAVAEDPGLTARVLRVASAPLYGVVGGVTSLRAAVLRLGQVTLRDVLYQAVAEAHVFRGGAERRLEILRAHSVGVGHATRVVAQAVGSRTEDAFLCGLLHDLGRPILLQVLAEGAGEVPEEQWSRVIDLAHVDVGVAVGRMWGLPAAVLDGIAHHHGPRPGGPARQPEDQGAGALVAAGEALAYHYGVGDRSCLVRGDEPAFAALGLEPPQVQVLVQSVASSLRRSTVRAS
jgi:putative nucleotidyltransferase with HDIG domain